MIRFADIFGQERAIDAIQQACLADRLPHGLIFAGPVGVGKATTARALAALFLCERPSAAEACGQCSSCTVFAADNHPDYHLIYRQLIRLEKAEAKARDLPIAVVRQYLVGPANLKPMMNRGKVFVIEEAELMNASAQNALLKTLEEPVGRTLIILLTDQPGSLLPTIRSRSQLVRFAPLDEQRVRQELEKRSASSADAADAARFAEGSLGLAMRWLEDGVVASARELRQQLDALIAGEAPIDLPEWFKTVSEQYAARQLERDELASKDQATREGLSLYLRLAAQELRRRLGDEQDPERLEALCAAIDAVARAEQYVDANVTLALIFQQLTVRLERLFVGAAGSR